MKTTFEEFNNLIDRELGDLRLNREHMITNGTSDKLKSFIMDGGISRLDLSSRLKSSIELVEQVRSARNQ